MKRRNFLASLAALVAAPAIVKNEDWKKANPSLVTTEMNSDAGKVLFEGYSVKVSLSSAEILALNASPKLLAAAPGSGKMIEVLKITKASILEFDTIRYTPKTIKSDKIFLSNELASELKVNHIIEENKW